MQPQPTNTQPHKLAYTVKEAASLLSLSRSFLYELIHSNRIATITIGKARRITKGQLEDYLKKREAEAESF